MHHRLTYAEASHNMSSATDHRGVLPSRTTPEGVETTLGSLISLLPTKVPKGFENFLPRNARTGDGGGGVGGGGDGDGGEGGHGKGGGGDHDDERNGKKKEGKERVAAAAASSSSSKSSEKKSGGGGFGNDKKNDDKRRDEERQKQQKEEEQMQLFGTTLLLILVLAARSFFDDDSSGGGGVGGGGRGMVGGDGPEVTWSDFYNYMLTEGDVERIVVVNKKTARVHLRPGARGVPVAAGGGGGPGGGGGDATTLGGPEPKGAGTARRCAALGCVPRCAGGVLGMVMC
jgi:hypothetical protein